MRERKRESTRSTGNNNSTREHQFEELYKNQVQATSVSEEDLLFDPLGCIQIFFVDYLIRNENNIPEWTRGFFYLPSKEHTHSCNCLPSIFVKLATKQKAITFTELYNFLIHPLTPEVTLSQNL